MIHRDVNNIDEEIKDRERIAKQIAKTSDSICKKYRALKAGEMKEDIALERHFKPIIELLKQIVENTVGEKFDVKSSENETFFLGEEEPKSKQKRSNSLFDNSLIPTSTLIKSMLKRLKTVPSNLREASKILQRKLSYEHSHAPSVEDIFEVADEPLVSSIQHSLQTSEGQEKLQTHYGLLGQKYLGVVLSDKQAVYINNVYIVYFSSDGGTMFSDKRIDLDKNDDIIVDGKNTREYQVSTN